MTEWQNFYCQFGIACKPARSLGITDCVKVLTKQCGFAPTCRQPLKSLKNGKKAYKDYVSELHLPTFTPKQFSLDYIEEFLAYSLCKRRVYD